MKKKILKPAENYLVKNMIKYYKLDTDLYIYTTLSRTSHGSKWPNKDIILTNQLPDGVFEYIEHTKEAENWMMSYLCGRFNCCEEELKIKLRKILLTAMPD